MRWEWLVEGHVVTAELSLLTGREVMRIDQTTLFNKISLKLKNVVAVPLASGRDARVVVKLGKMLFLPVCVLEVDGETITPTKGSSAERGDLTWWQWALFGACAIIPVLTLGGALPMLIAAVSAGTNWNIATSAKSNAAKAASMSVVTLLAWIALLALFALLNAPRS